MYLGLTGVEVEEARVAMVEVAVQILVFEQLEYLKTLLKNGFSFGQM